MGYVVLCKYGNLHEKYGCSRRIYCLSSYCFCSDLFAKLTLSSCLIDLFRPMGSDVILVATDTPSRLIQALKLITSIEPDNPQTELTIPT